MTRLLALLAGVVVLLPTTAAWADDPFSSDGWSTWRVSAVEDAADWCCYHWSAGKGQRRACDLQAERQGIGSPGRPERRPGDLQLWLRVHNGVPNRLVALSADCPVKETVNWRDLGEVDSKTSLAWLNQLDAGGYGDWQGTLAAVAAHAGPESAEQLRQMARTDANPERRSQAVFWMGQLRVEETRDTLLQLMRLDRDPKLRDQAIFSFAQSPARDRYDVLIALIEDPKESLDGRKQALFWLAQAEDGSGVNYIHDLLTR